MNATRQIRNESARRQELGHLAVSRYLILASGKAETCFSPRPDVIYSMGGEMKFSPEFQELGYEFAFDNSGTIALDTGKKNFYGQYMIDRQLFAKAGLEFERSHISVEHQ
jgi:hypothetical protein